MPVINGGSSELFGVKENRQYVTLACLELENFWRKNIHTYFDKTDNYSITRGNKGNIYTSKHIFSTSGKLANSISVKCIGNKIIAKAGRDNRGYDVLHALMYGTKTSTKRFDPILGVRLEGGTRKGTTNEQWEKWMSVYNAEFHRVLNDLVDKCADNLAKQVVEDGFNGMDSVNVRRYGL